MLFRSACNKASSSRPACCAALHSYIATRQKQIFVTNLQAINCATMFGSMLQKAGVGNDIYELCDIDLKDFSLQGMHGRCQNFRLISIILECKLTLSISLAPFIQWSSFWATRLVLFDKLLPGSS